MKSLILAVGAGLCIVGVSIAPAHLVGEHGPKTPIDFNPSGSQPTAPAGGTGAAIPAPDRWMAFEADVRKIENVDGRVVPVMDGRFYRNSDGSTRFDSGPPGGPIKVTSITNVAEEKYYEWVGAKWTSYPMRLPPGGLKPGKRRVDMQGLVAVTALHEGMTIYRYSVAGGPVTLKAPALNFFSVVTESGETRQEFVNIQRREQPSDLFAPPPTAIVEQSLKLNGIVWKPAANH